MFYFEIDVFDKTTLMAYNVFIIRKRDDIMKFQVYDMRCHPGDSAFLLDDGTTSILWDTGFAFTGEGLASKVKAHLGDRPLDYVFLSHSHYDHVLGSAYVLKHYPAARVVASEYTKKIFAKDSAKALMRTLDGKAGEACGMAADEDLIDNLRVDIALNDGETITCGSTTFECISLPGHTRCCIGFYCREENYLLGCETMGVFMPESLYVVPSCLVGYQMSLDSIEKAKTLAPKLIVAPHCGLLTVEESALYLERGISDTKATGEAIAEILRKGGSREDGIRYFIEKYYSDDVKDKYPIDAMLLNTGIMVDLIKKELFSDSKTEI